MKTLLAYHNDPALKQSAIARMEEHRKADTLVRGNYWDGHRGCAVGCLVHISDSPHTAVQKEFGIPIELAHLEDAIFERLRRKHLDWPVRFLSAIRPGADLSMVWPKFALWLLMDKKHGAIRFTKASTTPRKAIEQVGALYRRWIESGEKPPKDEWTEAARATWEAARATWEAARATWEAAVAAAAEAAAAWGAAWDRMAEKLIELLEKQ